MNSDGGNFRDTVVTQPHGAVTQPLLLILQIIRYVLVAVALATLNDYE
jgi:hypothetical protein